MRRPSTALAPAALLLGGCASAPSALAPRGSAASSIVVLWWVLLGLGTAVFVVVAVYLLVATLRRHPGGPSRVLTGADERFIAAWGIAIPAIILLVVLGLTISTGASTYRPPSEPAVTVEITGHQFWWEVRYPDSGVVTANEVHIPAGEPVRLLLEARDVIHSFWVPQLHGKMDMIPGRTNEFWIDADEPGTYRGVCAEFCGLQHAQMHLLVIATPAQEFEGWLTAQASDADPAEGTAVAGEELYIANCLACHAVRGLGEPSEAGPDLTHLGTRSTLAAGMQDNDRDNLREWIRNPHESKPGIRMPAFDLPDEDLEKLLDYLEGLR